VGESMIARGEDVSLAQRIIDETKPRSRLSISGDSHSFEGQFCRAEHPSCLS